MRRLTIIRSHNDCRKTILLQIGEQTYTSVFNGVVTCKPKHRHSFLCSYRDTYTHKAMHVLCMCVHHQVRPTTTIQVLVSEMKENIKLEAIASHIFPAYSTTLTPGNLGCRALPCFDSFMSRLGDGSCVRVCVLSLVFMRGSQYFSMTH